MFFKGFKISIIITLIIIIVSGVLLAEQPSFDLVAKSAILLEYETGEIIYEKNSDQKLPPASMTKIMTMLLVMEALEEGRAKLEDKLVVSELAASMGGSQIWLEPGEEMTLEEMMKSIAIVSANDSCVAVAEYLYGTEEDFVKRMNDRASELGLKNTYFYNTNGLPPTDPAIEGNYTSAHDLAKMGKELLKYPKVLEWTSTWIDYLRNGESVLNNTNRLVRFYNGADGLKTGYTEEARYCVTSTAIRNGLRFISVVMGVDDSKVRFNEAAKLLSYGFSIYDGLKVAEKDQIIKELNISNGKSELANAISGEDLIVPVRKGEKEKIKKIIEIDERVKAPLVKGDKIGIIKVYKGNLLLKQTNLVIDRDVAKASLWQLIGRIMQYLINSLVSLFR